MIGQTISHYRILSELGHGGMGVVYEAEDTRLGRRVALKFLRENLAHDPIAFQRLQREARAACRLNHPSICTIHEIEEENGQPVIVMELLEGESLKDRLQKRPISFNEVLDLGIQIADALQAAHEVGVIHRDIKPANIFLSHHGSIKILDFGLAKLVNKHPPGATEATVVDSLDESLTAVGTIPGTTSYMSPEQAKGEPLDPRTDLFSLGAVLYELATGGHPFRRKNQIVTINAILNRRPKPPSRIRPDLPAGFDAIISKALAKDPAQRYQTAAELRDVLWDLKAKLGPTTSRSFSYQEIATARAPTREGAIPARGPVAPSGASRLRHWRIIVPVSLVIVAAVVVALLVYPHRARGLTEKDMVLLTDFNNKTGDEVFDEALRQALVVDLGQSPFLNVLSERKVTAALRLMGRSPDERVVGEIARDVCQRLGGKAMLAGSISSLGSSYVIALNAVNCATGDSLVEEQIQARAKEDVLKALGNAATELRGKLGESLASVQKFSTPIEEATTPSLDALKAYSIGRRVSFQKGDPAALPYYLRAVELDPNFALGYRALSAAYTNLGQTTRGMENAKKAFELSDRVSEREKYAISSRYYSDGTGELDKANQVYELWKQSYPHDFLPFGNLGDNYMRLGQWEKALQETEEVEHLEPNSAVFNSNLFEIQLALGRSQEAEATLERAAKRKLDSIILRVDMYHAAFLRGDERAMQQQLAWAAGRSGEEDWLLSTQAHTEGYYGRLAKAREFSQRAVDSAADRDTNETAALWQADAALREAEFGHTDAARQKAIAAIARASGREIRSMAALALGRTGDVSQAQKIAERLNSDFPVHTIVQRYWLPSIHAAIAIDSNKPERAIQLLETARPYELAQCQPILLGMMYPTYLRGEAYLLSRDGTKAAAEFQNIIDHRGLVLNFPLGALAQLGLARAYALQGDVPKARAAYDQFLNLWKSADADVPILQQAKAESARLPR